MKLLTSLVFVVFVVKVVFLLPFDVRQGAENAIPISFLQRGNAVQPFVFHQRVEVRIAGFVFFGEPYGIFSYEVVSDSV